MASLCERICFLNCASGGSNNSASTMDVKGDDRLERKRIIEEEYGSPNNNGKAPQPFSDCQTPTSTYTVKTQQSSSSSKKQKLLHSLRKFRVRSSHSVAVHDRGSYIGDKDSSLQNGLSQSHPNLPASTSSTSKSSWFRAKTPKKSIIRRLESNSSSIQKANGSTRKNSNFRVEFSNADEVYSFPDTTMTMASPPQSIFPTPPTSLEKPPRYVTDSSVMSVNECQTPSLEQENSGQSSLEGEPANQCSYLLQVLLLEGKDLVIRDTCGTSDPYVKCQYKGKTVFKSSTVFKNLNPQWNEQFSCLIDDLSVPLLVDVYDYDRFAFDDYMGSATVDLSQFLTNQFVELKLVLKEENNEEYMGYLWMKINVSCLSVEEKAAFVKKTTRSTSSESTTSKKTPQKAMQVWSSVVNIVLVEAKNLLSTDPHTNSAQLPDPYVRFKLGAEKYKSKPALKSLEPKWLEQFDLHIYEERKLEIRVFDKRKDVFMGRCSILLTDLEREITHQNWYDLEDGAGQILLLISISGTLSSDTVADFKIGDANLVDRPTIYERYKLGNSFQNLRDVGHLTVKVFKAQGLAAADIGGKSDPFCVVELVNARLQTHTEYKTLSPEWNKIFTFHVKDIHSVLELTVFDEDPNNKVEFLGKVAIPLLKIRNGEKRWYALKDKKLQRRAKGQILLEFELYWNPIRASIRTVNPREDKYMGLEPKFKRQTFTRNVMRVKQFAMSSVEVGAFVQSCWSWDSPVRSLIAFLVFLVSAYFMELYMLPLALLMLFMRAYVHRIITEGVRAKDAADEYFETDDDDDDQGGDDKQHTQKTREERKSLKERLQAVQDTLATVQNVLDYIACMLERIKNTFNFTQPFLSWFAIVVLSIGVVITYLVPLRWLIILWGINKFTKKLRSPHAIPNNELLDFLSRVPSDDEIRKYGEFRPESVDALALAVNAAAQVKKKRLS